MKLVHYGVGHSETSTLRHGSDHNMGKVSNWYTVGLVHYGTGTLWDWYSVGLVHYGTGTQ